MKDIPSNENKTLVKKEMTSTRRNLLKNTALAAAFISAAGVTRAFAKDKHGDSEWLDEPGHGHGNGFGQGHGNGHGPLSWLDTSKEILPYYPIPEQVPVMDGIVPVGDDGAGLYYWDTGGHGPVIVFAHPGTGSALTWPYQQPVLANAGFRVIAYSRRGYHLSPGGDPANPGTYAGDLKALVDYLGIGKFHLVGAAAGGFVVTDFAVSFPQRLHSMVVSASLFGTWDQEIVTGFIRLLGTGFTQLPPAARELSPSYRAVHTEGVTQWLDMEEASKGAGPTITQRNLSVVNWDALNAVRIPKLLITGASDLYQPPSLMKLAAQKLRRSKSVVIPEVAHAPHWEAPKVFNKILKQFIRSR